MTNQKEIETLAKKLWSENEDVATELANVIFGIRDGDYETKIEYPIFKKTSEGNVIKLFSDAYEDNVWVVHNLRDRLGDSTGCFDCTIKQMTDVPYDKERGLYHGQPSYVWDNDDTHQKSIAFYDAINRCIFTSKGQLDGEVWDNYEAIPTEHIPEWMYEKYLTLEGI